MWILSLPRRFRSCLTRPTCPLALPLPLRLTGLHHHVVMPLSHLLLLLLNAFARNLHPLVSFHFMEASPSGPVLSVKKEHIYL